MLTLPDGPKVAAIAACYNGPIDSGEDLVRPLRELGPPMDDGHPRRSALLAAPLSDLQ